MYLEKYLLSVSALNGWIKNFNKLCRVMTSGAPFHTSNLTSSPSLECT